MRQCRPRSCQPTRIVDAYRGAKCFRVFAQHSHIRLRERAEVQELKELSHILRANRSPTLTGAKRIIWLQLPITVSGGYLSDRVGEVWLSPRYQYRRRSRNRRREKVYTAQNKWVLLYEDDLRGWTIQNASTAVPGAIR